MEYIVIGRMVYNAPEKDRLISLKRYLRRDASKFKAVTLKEFWADGHPRDQMVLHVSAPTRKDLLDLLAPWQSICDMNIIDVVPMRAAIEKHLASHEAGTAQPVAKMTEPVAAEVQPQAPDFISNGPTAPPLPAKLKAILTSNEYDDTWPEDSYTGKKKEAYDSIVEQLGGIPKLGQLASNAMDNVTKPPNPSEEYTEVYKHLVSELGYFQKCELWFGHGRNVESFVSETTITNLGIITKLKEDTALLKTLGLHDGLSISLFLKVLFGLLGVASAAAEFPLGGAILGFMGSNATDFGQGTKEKVDTTFAKVAEDLNVSFNSMITGIENWNASLHSNWGKLSTFGSMVEHSELVWPIDTQKPRDAAAIAFETYLWRLIFPKLKNLYRGHASRRSVTSLGQPWNPNNGNYVYRVNEPGSWQTGCPSKTVTGYIVHDFEFGGIQEVDVGYGAFVTAGPRAFDWIPPNIQKVILPLPKDFNHHLFGTTPINGALSLGIDVKSFFDFKDKDGPWYGIQGFDFGQKLDVRA